MSMKYRLILSIICIIAFMGLLFTSYYYNTTNRADDITVAYLSSDHEAAFMVAQDQDMYKKAGLNVKVHRCPPGQV